MTPTIPLIQRLVAAEYGVTVEELKGRRRAAAIVRPRHVAMALAAQLSNRSFPAIARAFGNRDHTTVLYARDTIAHRCLRDPAFAEELAGLRRAIVAEADRAAEEVLQVASETASAVAAAFSRALFELVRQDPMQALATMRPLVHQLVKTP